MSTTIDGSDQQKRERIEKYKEQRRSKLRAKYKMENYLSSSQSSLESQSAEESSLPTSRKRKVCTILLDLFDMLPKNETPHSLNPDERKYGELYQRIRHAAYLITGYD